MERKFKDLKVGDCLILLNVSTGFCEIHLIEKIRKEVDEDGERNRLWFTYEGAEGFFAYENEKVVYTKGMTYIFGTSLDVCREVLADVYLKKINDLIKKRDRVLKNSMGC